jgi:hypothetical protein
VKAEVKRQFFGEIFSRWDMGFNALRNRDGVPTSSNYVGLKYSLAPGQSLSLRQTFTFTPPNADVESRRALGDTYINYFNGSLAKLAGDQINIGLLALRAYAPTGAGSQASGQQFRNLGWLAATAAVGKFEFNQHLIWNYFVQGRDFNTNAKGDRVATPELSVTHMTEVGYQILPELSVAQSISVGNDWTRPVDGRRKMENGIGWTTGVTYASPYGALLLYLNNDIPVEDPQVAFQLYRPEQMSYTLIYSHSI